MPQTTPQPPISRRKVRHVGLAVLAGLAFTLAMHQIRSALHSDRTHDAGNAALFGGAALAWVADHSMTALGATCMIVGVVTNVGVFLLKWRDSDDRHRMAEAKLHGPQPDPRKDLM